ncbi:RNA-binding protein 28 [Mactra antiquata]
MTSVKECKTIFVRNIPYSITKENLEDKFSDFGPIKQCFIVKEKGSEKSRGFGYVTYSLFEDAKKAKESKVSLDGRQVTIEYADNSRKKRTPRKTKDEESNVDNIDNTDGDTTLEVKVETGSDVEEDNTNNETTQGIQQTKKYHNAKIVLLSGLPENITNDELNHCVQKMGVKQLAECNLLPSGRSAQLKFKCIRDAKRAIRKLHNHPYRDSMLQAVQMSKDISTQDPKTLKKSRLIVRNLSFQCTEEQLMKSFQHCGEITEVKVPTNPGGKKLGFGFIQFTNLFDANKAVEQMNTHKILGRPVAVDWALPKAKYEMSQNKKDDDDDSGDDDDDDDGGGGGGGSDDENLLVKDNTTKQNKEMVKSQNTESDDDDDDGEEGGSSSNDDDDGDDSNDDDDNGKSDDDDDSNDDDDDDSDDDDDKETSPVISKRPVSTKSDTDDGCTLFLRNLSYDTTEEGLEEYFTKYGALKYAKVVVNPETEHSKGLGFVRFCLKECADKCLQSGEAGNINIDNRQIYVSLAVSRQKAATFKEKKQETKDNRNLHLAREGMIRPGTQAAEGLSKLDLDKRMKVEEVKRRKLKNLNIFISPFRLCVRNIPVNVDDKQLRQVYKDAARDTKAFITECRVMRDRTHTNTEGTGKSMGYGFVCFKDHQHALTALRNTNNNPDIFGEKKRLIVEFSLENRKALETKERRQEKQKAKKEFERMKSEEIKGRKLPPNNKKLQISLLQMSEKDKKLKGDKLQKGLPSHWGPKIRHKKRPTENKKGKGKQQFGKQGQKGQQVQKGQKRKFNDEPSNMSTPVKQKKRKQTDNDNFDKLVDKYKNNLLSKKNKTKWFQ